MSENEYLENTEILEENNSETYAEVVVDDTATIQLLTDIRDSLNIVVVFTIVTFVTACLRGWRKNAVKGVR